MHWKKQISIIVAMLFSSTIYGANILMSLGPEVGVISLKDDGAEPTPDYKSLGGDVTIGYYWKSGFTLGLYGRYLPAKKQVTDLETGYLHFYDYGGDLALRGKNLILSLRGGRAGYVLGEDRERLQETNAEIHPQGVGASLGVGIYSRWKGTLWEFLIRAGSHLFENQELNVARRQRLDTLGFSTVFTFY